jgi:peroxiredoxin family protein
MKTKLGILVNSSKHLDYVVALARAAHASGKDVHVHLTQQGVFLLRQKAFSDLTCLARVSVCKESVEIFGLETQINNSRKKFLAPSCRLAEVLRDCDRCVVF